MPTSVAQSPRLFRVWRLIIAALTIAALVAAAPATIARAQSSTPAAEPAAIPVQPASDASLGYPALTVIATDTGFAVPDGLTADRYFMTTRNAGTFWSHYFTLRVPDEVTDAELAASMETEDDLEWLFTSDVVGNADQTLPGKETHEIVDLAAGRYILVDPIRGLTGAFTVSAATSAATPLEPAHDLDVTMREMLFAGVDSSMPSGQTVWKVTNDGAVWHEAVIVRVADGSTDASLLAEYQALTAESGPDETFIQSLVAGSGVISPGNTAWLVLDLEPGTYGVICSFPDDTGRIHAMLGMVKVFTVS